MNDLGFIDRIFEIKNDTIYASKNLTINEDYLLDHFEDYPVMPGVLMTQALVEAGGWWLKNFKNFKIGDIGLKQVKNVKFANFLRPGDILDIEVKNKSCTESTASFQAKGKSEEKTVLSLQFTINYSILSSIFYEEDVLEQEKAERAFFRQLCRLQTEPGSDKK